MGNPWEEYAPQTAETGPWSEYKDARKRLDVIDPPISQARAQAELDIAKDRPGYAPTGQGPWFSKLDQDFTAGLGSFWPRVATGVKQGAAYLGVGDPEKAKQEAAEQARLNAPLFGTPGGFTGKLVPDLAIAAAGGGASTIPRQIAGNIVTGAGLEAVTPEPGGYNLPEKLKRGAFVGGLSDLAGRGAGFLMRPFSKTSPGSIENAAITERAGLPYPLPSTRSTEGLAGPLTQTLEKIPILNTFLKKKLDANAEFYTRFVTEGTGTPVSNITDSTRRLMKDNLDTVSNTFKATGAPADQTIIQQNIKTAKATLGEDLAATGSREAINRMNDAINALKPGHGLSAEQLLGRRSVATQSLQRAESAAEKSAFAAIRDAYDDAFIAANPHFKDDFTRWKDQFGKFIEINAAGDKGLGRVSTLDPSKVRAETNFQDRVARTPREQFIQASHEQNLPELSGLHHFGQGLLFGAPVAAGVATDWLKGEPGAGSVGGTALSAAMIAALSRRPTSAFSADMARRAMAAALMTGGTEYRK